MLQGLNLPIFDIASLESGLNYSVSLPEQGIEPDTAFADIFKLQPQTLPAVQAGAGSSLPQNGNLLPLNQDEPAVVASIELFDPEQPQPEVLATNPLPIAILQQSNAAIRVVLADGRADGSPVAPAPVATQVAAVLPEASPIRVETPNLEGAVARSAEGHSKMPVAQDPVTSTLPAKVAIPRAALSAEAPLARVGSELPIPPVSSDAASNVRDQVAVAIKAPLDLAELRRVIAPDRQAMSPTRVTRDAPPQGIKLTSPVPMEQQIPAMVPVASNTGETLAPQQIHINPTSVAQIANRTGSEASITTPQPAPLVTTPVTDTSWGDRIGDRLMLMANNKAQTAEIRLTPAELGPLRVRIAIEDGVASVNFNAQHAVTREALEQAMPRLRELFAENGLTLEQSDIAESDEHGVAQGRQDRDDEQAQASNGSMARDEISEADTATSDATLQPRSDKLVDTFV